MFTIVGRSIRPPSRVEGFRPGPGESSSTQGSEGMDFKSAPGKVSSTLRSSGLERALYGGVLEATKQLWALSLQVGRHPHIIKQDVNQAASAR